MRRRIVSWETPYASATVRSGSFCSTTRCTTVGHCPVGRLYAGCFGPGRRCLITQEEGFPQLFPLQQAGVAPSDTVFLSGQGRESKLVTEDSKPVGSGLTIRKLPYFFHTAVFLCLTSIDLWWVFSERMFQGASSGFPMIPSFVEFPRFLFSHSTKPGQSHTCA